MPSIAMLEKLLDAGGYTLTVSRPGTELAVDHEWEKLRDRGGRHYPAHLPLAGKPRYMGDGPDWWGWHRIAWYWSNDPSVPEHMYWHPRRGRPRRRNSDRVAPWDDAT